MNNIEKSRGNLLLEFFSEEIPARMQLNSEIQLQNLFVKSLTQRDIAYESIKTFSEYCEIISSNKFWDYSISYDLTKYKFNSKKNLVIKIDCKINSNSNITIGVNSKKYQNNFIFSEDFNSKDTNIRLFINASFVHDISHIIFRNSDKTINNKFSIHPTTKLVNGSPTLYLNNVLEKEGLYYIKNKDSVIKTISLNSNRKESEITSFQFKDFNSSLEKYDQNSLFKLLRSNQIDNKREDFTMQRQKDYWIYFIILALIFIILEILIIRYYEKPV